MVQTHQPCVLQVFNPYTNPQYTLPIPATARPNAVKTTSNLNFPQAASGGVFRLAGANANATTMFALRFTGASKSRECCGLPVRRFGCMWTRPADTRCRAAESSCSQLPRRSGLLPTNSGLCC